MERKNKMKIIQDETGWYKIDYSNYWLVADILLALSVVVGALVIAIFI